MRPITGRVLDAGGRPLEGAWVRFVATGTSVTTGPDGEFRLPGPPGDPDDPSRRGWRVRVAHGGRAAEAVAGVRPPGESGPFLRIVVSDVTDVVAVAVERVGGTRLRYPVCELVVDGAGVVVDSKMGGEFGDVRFLDVPDGSYLVRVRTSERGGSASFVVRDGRTIPTIVHVHTQPVETIDGTLADERGRPAAGVPLRLDVLPASARTLPGLRTTTDPQGHFRFVLYGARAHDVELDGEGYGRLRSRHVRSGRANELELDRR